MYWHEDCLKCGCCDCRLGEVGHSLYTKVCLEDYKRDCTPVWVIYAQLSELNEEDTVKP